MCFLKKVQSHAVPNTFGIISASLEGQILLRSDSETTFRELPIQARDRSFREFQKDANLYFLRQPLFYCHIIFITIFR